MKTWILYCRYEGKHSQRHLGWSRLNRTMRERGRVVREEEKRERGEDTGQAGQVRGPGPRETPRKGMNKMAGFCRTRSSGRKPSLWFGRV